MKIKIVLSLIFALIIQIKSFTQNKNEIKLFYGILNSDLTMPEDVYCSCSQGAKKSYEFGVNYLKMLSKKVGIETGVTLSNYSIELSSQISGYKAPYTENLKLFSVPIYVNYKIGKYFFANAGPILDFPFSEISSDFESGIGYGIGIGGKYNFDNFLIYISPNYKRHSLIPFKKNKFHNKLSEKGLQFGIAYSF